VEAAGDVARDEAERLLNTTDGEVKTAIVMALCDLDVERSRAQLLAAGGHVRKALTTNISAQKGDPDGHGR
jgi:N-acetylmuramic acid 6-phosphate (MurNAc-6-P) etherase